MEQLVDLLSDESLFGDLKNLVVNREDRWKPYCPPEGTNNLDEVFDGKYYIDTIRLLLTRTDGSQFLIPIMIYVDKTGTDAFQRNGLEPVVFTTPLLSRAARNNPRAWRILGFVPDLDAKSSAVKEKARGTAANIGLSCRNYHTCLAEILKSFKDAQGLAKDDNLNAWLQLGDEAKLCRLQIPLAFIVGDAKSGDMLCGRYGGYKCNRMSRQCDVPFNKCADPNHECVLLRASDMERWSFLASEEFVLDERDQHVGQEGDKAPSLPTDAQGRTERCLDVQRKKIGKN